MTLPTDYQTFIATSRYARWLSNEGRRETWPETVQRYFDFFEPHLKKNHGFDVHTEFSGWAAMQDAVLNLRVMPSMRCLMTAGPALAQNHIAGYNCAYLPVNSVEAFAETMLILMNGTGVGFSVESKYVGLLPQIPAVLSPPGRGQKVIRVDDSKEGWATAFEKVVKSLYSGTIPAWNTANLRPPGARLNTFGGRASGPAPLEALFEFTCEIFQKAKGRKLTSLEAHDVMCKIGEVVVVGGVRRSAMISLSDLSDDNMRVAKSGAWWENNGQRALANNSYVLEGTPDMAVFLTEMKSLYDSKSGERGIFSRDASRIQAEKIGRELNHEWGTNPCSEIILRPNQFCNLSEVIARADDTMDDLISKVRIAAWLGTIQSTLTDFKGLRSIWKENTEEERLLGVSITGILDCPLLNGRIPEGLDTRLEHLKNVARVENESLSHHLGIQRSAAITCVKPSGTVSQLTDTASGIHARHAEYYIRTVRGDNKDPLTQFLKQAGVPFESCVMKPNDTTVFSFPMQSPAGAITRDELSAIEHLKLWLTYQRHWCDHKPSVTITYRDEEFPDVQAFVWKHIREISGISFLPHSDHTYQQAPYQTVTKVVYDALANGMPPIDWSQLSVYEKEDTTTGSQELACVAGGCEI